jgi:hypothetical protein
VAEVHLRRALATSRFRRGDLRSLVYAFFGFVLAVPPGGVHVLYVRVSHVKNSCGGERERDGLTPGVFAIVVPEGCAVRPARTNMTHKAVVAEFAVT